MGIALWLVPSVSDATKIKRLMRVPQTLEPLPYTLPSFDPHITLSSFPSSTSPSILRTAVVDALKECNKISMEISQTERTTSMTSSNQSTPLTAKFAALATGDHFFRSVLLDIVPSDMLLEVHRRIIAALPGIEARSPRYPHLSLFYVPDEYANDRERIRDALWSMYGTESGPGEIAFEYTEQNVEGNRSLFTGIEVLEIWTVICEDDIKNWTVIDKIRINDTTIF